MVLVFLAILTSLVKESLYYYIRDIGHSSNSVVIEAGPFSSPRKGLLRVIARVCHSRENGNPCGFASLMDSRFHGNDRKLNSPVTNQKNLDRRSETK